MNETEKMVKYVLNLTKNEFPKVQKLLSKKRLIIVPLAQKMGGKTTVLQIFTKALGDGLFESVSAGEIIREIKKEAQTEAGKEKTVVHLSKEFQNPSETLQAILESSSGNLVDDEIIFKLIEQSIKEIDKHKSIILDGIPRSEKQIKYVKMLENDLDMPIFYFYFDVDYKILDLRADSRRVCPKCKLDKNIISNPTSKVIFKNGEFILLCDNCGVEMVKKTGDENPEDILIARESYDKLMHQIKEEVGKELIWIHASVPATGYKGPIEEVNRSYKFKNTRNGVVAEVSLVTVDSKTGPIHSFSTEKTAILMIKELAKHVS